MSIEAARLWKEGMAPWILPSGKYSIGKGAFTGVQAMKEKYQGPYQTEWEFMKDVLLKEGVPEEVILREDGATFTYQNAINSRKVTDAVGIRVKKAIICCKAQHARRCKLYYQYLYPQTTFLICPSDVGINRENWFDTQKGRKEVLGEVEKCGEQLQRIFCREADSWSIGEIRINRRYEQDVIISYGKQEGVMAAYVEMDQVTKTYQMGEVTIKAADGISFQVEKGEFVVVVGPSGAGKTTVLNILGGMDTATTGKVSVDGTRVDKLKGKKLIQYRREDIGFVFQFYNLMQNLTALENVELALQICKDPLDAKTVLEEVGLGERMYNFPAQLSGGEQQRVAIARALAKNPKLLLCDEPTGALDYVTGKSILKLLQDTCHKKGMTVIVITHNSALTPMADRIVRIRNGRVAEVIQNENPTPVEEIEW